MACVHKESEELSSLLVRSGSADQHASCFNLDQSMYMAFIRVYRTGEPVLDDDLAATSAA